MLEQVPKGSDHVRNEFVLIKTHPNMFFADQKHFRTFLRQIWTSSNSLTLVQNMS